MPCDLMIRPINNSIFISIIEQKRRFPIWETAPQQLRGLLCRFFLCSLGSFFCCHFSSSLSFLFFLSLCTLCSSSFNGWTIVRLSQCSVEEVQLGWLLFSNLQGAFSTWKALRLLPVAGDLQQCQYWLGWLSANADPVLCALGVDFDNRWLFLRLVDAQVLDCAAGTAGAGVSNDDAVLCVTYLTDTLKFNLCSHDWLLTYQVTGQYWRLALAKPVQPLEIFLRVTAGRPWSVAALRSRACSHNLRYVTGIFANFQNLRGRIGVDATNRVVLVPNSCHFLHTFGFGVPKYIDSDLKIFNEH